MKRDYTLSSDLSIKGLRLGQNAWVVSPHGSIDSATSREFGDKIREFLDEKPSHLLLDMAGVKYISSMGLGALLSLLKKFEKSGFLFALYDTSLPVRRVLEISKLDFLLIHAERVDKSHPFSEYIDTHEPDRKKRREEEAAREQAKKSVKK